jgi:hypothetical protein
MTRHALAEALRAFVVASWCGRPKDSVLLDAEALREMCRAKTDEEIIQDILRCRICRRQLLTGPALEAAIASACSAPEFIRNSRSGAAHSCDQN